MTSDPLRVLIVEDEVMLAMAMEDVLADAGHVVVGTAASKKDAIAMADATSPDLVFVDVHLLDGPTGLDIAAHLRAVEGTMVVFMTANAKKVPDDFVGAMGIIAKPYSQAGIADAIRYLEECVRRPPPSLDRPYEFTIAPAYERYLALTSG